MIIKITNHEILLLQKIVKTRQLIVLLHVSKLLKTWIQENRRNIEGKCEFQYQYAKYLSYAGLCSEKVVTEYQYSNKFCSNQYHKILQAFYHQTEPQLKQGIPYLRSMPT